MKNHLSNLIIALRDSYLSLLGFLIISSIGSVLFQLEQSFNLTYLPFDHLVNLLSVGKLFPLLLSVSLAYHLAKIHQTDRIVNVTLSLSILISIVISSSPNGAITISGKNHPILILIIPIIASYIFKFLVSDKLVATVLQQKSLQFSTVVKRNFLAFFLTYLFTTLFITAVGQLLNPFVLELKNLIDDLHLPVFSLMLIRTVCAHLLWLIGVHGGNTFDLLFNTQFLLQPIVDNVGAKQILDVFVLFGGSGCCLALSIAIYLFTNDQHARSIVKMGLPFSVFNISEIIFYGLPVLFNKKLYLPFLLTPLVNFLLIYVLIHYSVIDLHDNRPVPWTTPIFLNAYLMSNGQLLPVWIQVFSLIIDVLIYAPFVKRYSQTQSPQSLLNALQTSLNIQERVESQASVHHYQSQEKIIQFNSNLHEIIKTIASNALEIHYQPIHDCETKHCAYFEALLRLRLKDQTTLTPYFLPDLENAGYAWVIDSWVCKRVAEDLAQFGDLAPKISINLHPDSMRNRALISDIMLDLQGCKIQFELIERASFDDEQLKQNVEFVQFHNYAVAIDDFGTGYSNLGNLFSAPSKIIKLDKSFSDQLDSQRGRLLYQHTVRMCKDLGFTLIAEGIETQHQFDLVVRSGVDYIQGHFYSKALPLEQAIRYFKKHQVQA